MERWLCKPSFVRCDQPRNQSSGCKRDEENQKTKQRREIGARLFRLWARSLFAGGFQLLLAVTAPGDDTDPGHARCHQSDQARFGRDCGIARIIGECKETKRAKQSSKTYKSHGFLLGRPSAETVFRHLLTGVEMASGICRSGICRMWFSKGTSGTLANMRGTLRVLFRQTLPARFAHSTKRFDAVASFKRLTACGRAAISFCRVRHLSKVDFAAERNCTIAVQIKEVGSGASERGLPERVGGGRLHESHSRTVSTRIGKKV